MKQLFIQRGNPRIMDVPIPLVNDNNVLVQVYYSFVSSGTEIATLNSSRGSLATKFLRNTAAHSTKLAQCLHENGLQGTAALIKEKNQQVLPIGYACTGKVIHVGANIKGIAVGDFVACAGAEFAYHADVVSVPQHLLVKLKSNKFLKQTSICTIGAIAMQGIRRANVQLGEKIAIIGLGLIGQLTLQLTKLSGAEIFGIDVHEQKLELARRSKADNVYDNKSINATRDILFATGHIGVDTTIITAAATTGELINQAMQITRRKGKVILVGDVALNFNREEFYSKEIDLLISCSYGPGRYDNSYEKSNIDYPYAYVRWTEQRNLQLFAELIEQERINIDSLISHEFDIGNADQAYTYLKERSPLGIVFSYQSTEKATQLDEILKNLIKTDEVKPFKQVKKIARIGVIGAGGFCKTKLLPIINNQKNVKIHALVDPNSATLVNLARLYDAHIIANDYRKLVHDEDINAVIIASPHAFHTEQTLAFLEQGKAVLVEKPIAVTFEELSKITSFLKNNKRALFSADFNRSYAPCIQKIKPVVDVRTNPLLISYRMNAGFIPLDHWIQSDLHRGRIIGEACHIFELFCFLTNAAPRTIHVAALRPKTKDLACNDNVSISLEMTDGSVCSLIYSALGHEKISKEFMEIFVDGKSIVMDDYKNLRGYNLPAHFDMNSKQPEKGHKELISEFFDAIRTGSPLANNLERIYFATLISLHADMLARSGGGYINLETLESHTTFDFNAENISQSHSAQAASM